eukprot:3753443-Rhodomonas_salina.1
MSGTERARGCTRKREEQVVRREVAPYPSCTTYAQGLTETEKDELRTLLAGPKKGGGAVSYTHLRAHETEADL